MSNRPWIDPRLIDWTDGLNPLGIAAFHRDINRCVYDSLNEPILQQLRAGTGTMFVRAAPTDPNATLAPRATYDQALSLEPYSWLIGFSAHSTQAEGFLAQATDTVTGETLWSNPLTSANITGRPVSFLAMPRSVAPPAQLTVRLINLSANPNLCQLCLWFIQEPPQ